jgi:predicted nucleic acid-binding protein
MAKKITVAQISALAKKIRKPNEKWTDAIKRATAQLKKG